MTKRGRARAHAQEAAEHELTETESNAIEKAADDAAAPMLDRAQAAVLEMEKDNLQFEAKPGATAS